MVGVRERAPGQIEYYRVKPPKILIMLDHFIITRMSQPAQIIPLEINYARMSQDASDRHNRILWARGRAPGQIDNLLG